MADRSDHVSRPENDRETAPHAETRHPRQSEVNSAMSRNEAASRAQAARSGRGAAKWFLIGLVAVIAVIVLAGTLGGGWMTGSGDADAVVEEAE